MTETVITDDWTTVEEKAKEGHAVNLPSSAFLAMLRVAREQREEIERLHRRVGQAASVVDAWRPTSYFEDVREFHDAIGATNGEEPNARAVSVDRVKLRETLMDEEFRELLDAMWSDDIVGIADGCADLVVTVLGTAAEYGIPFEEVWDEVHRSNMSKAGGPKRADGKQEKPEGWEPPDIAGVLERVQTSEQGEGSP